MDAEPATQPAKPRRRWLRFSLRTFLLLITIFCIWLGIKVNAVRRQREAVAAILKAGGNVRYDYQPIPPRGKMNTMAGLAQKRLLAPQWLREWIGDDYFCNVVVVGFSDSSVDAATLGELTKLSGLKSLTIIRMPQPINASELESLGEVRSLRELFLNAPGIDGPAVASLVNLKQLKILRMLAMIDDVGMEQVGKMTTIEYLHVTGNNVTDSGYSHLQYLTNLDTLRLESCFISERTLLYLKELSNLKSLDLMNCVDDGGELNGLKQLKQLSELSLDGSNFSPASIRELQAALPTTKVSGP